MKFNQIPQTQLAISETTEAEIPFSGKTIPDNREIRQFVFFPNTEVNQFDNESFFTPIEVNQIFQSLIDLKLGKYKTFHSTEELFAELDK